MSPRREDFDRAGGSRLPADLMALARAGDDQAFADLIEPYAQELQVHCYRILGSAHDAEDALQDALLSAWHGLPEFEQHASLRCWLYRVTTNRCLQTLRARRRRTRPEHKAADIEPPEPTGHGEVWWLEPYPDVLLEGLIDQDPGPEARYEAREAISLAFVTALQPLAPRQRAVLILRDVPGFPARDVAGMLQTSEQSVTSALKRARSALQDRVPPRESRQPAPAPNSAAERATVEQLARAYEAADLDTIVRLLTDDVRLTMPHCPGNTRAGPRRPGSSRQYRCGPGALSAWCQPGRTASLPSASTCTAPTATPARRLACSFSPCPATRSAR